MGQELQCEKVGTGKNGCQPMPMQLCKCQECTDYKTQDKIPISFKSFKISLPKVGCHRTVDH